MGVDTGGRVGGGHIEDNPVPSRNLIGIYLNLLFLSTFRRTDLFKAKVHGGVWVKD